MKIEQQVPVTNREGKTVTLTLDTDTGKVAVRTPAMFSDPEVDLSTLHARVVRLHEMAAQVRGDR